MPVLPLVGSISVTPGLILPSRSAASIIAFAMRSLTLHSGFMFSSLARTVATHPSVTFRSCTSGVFPMHCVMSFLIPAGRLAVAMKNCPLYSQKNRRVVVGCSLRPTWRRAWRRSARRDRAAAGGEPALAADPCWRPPEALTTGGALTYRREVYQSLRRRVNASDLSLALLWPVSVQREWRLHAL